MADREEQKLPGAARINRRAIVKCMAWAAPPSSGAAPAACLLGQRPTTKLAVIESGGSGSC
jgi:hypothetical protein